MQNKVLIWLFVAAILAGCSTGNNLKENFRLEGSTEGSSSGKIYLQYGFLSFVHKDSSEIRNGKFSFHGNLGEPVIASLKIEGSNNQAIVFIEPGLIKVTFTDGNLSNPVVAGSASHEEYKKLMEIENSARNRDSLLSSYVIQNPHSVVALHSFTELASSILISPDSLRTLFARFDPALQKSRMGRMAAGMISKKENVMEGREASEFKAIDINGNLFTLSQFRGKNPVFIDFWASWCHPCKEGLSHLEKLFERYHEKGLEIIAVSCFETSNETWKEAISQNNIGNWHNAISVFGNGKVVNEDFLLDYPVLPLPRTILIDSQGKVAGSWEGKSRENYEAMDKAAEKLFEQKDSQK